MLLAMNQEWKAGRTFARRGHQVLAVDVSTVGIAQLRAVADREQLAVEVQVADIVAFTIDRTFDVVILDRVLHMLASPDRLGVLEVALDATASGGHLLVAEGPKGLLPVVERVQAAGWATPKRTRNRLIAQRPAG
ncbi:MAG: SAM-dependent methyltransferase [Myxococcota bacterium]